MFTFIKKQKQKGFTMIELLLVVAIMGLLTSWLLAYMEDSRGAARDANRKQQLRSMQTVLEFYRNETGAYPATGVNDWLYSCDNPTDYIPNLVVEGYASQLPTESDRCFGGSDYTGFWYSSTGEDFKLIFYNPYETPPAGDTFYDGNRPGPNLPKAIAICNDEALCLDEDTFAGFGAPI